MKKFFGWLFLTDGYMASLSDEQVTIRALGRRKAYVYEAQKRAVEAELGALFASVEESILSAFRSL